MPQTKSAKKALKQSRRKRLINLVVLKKLKAQEKKFKRQPTDNNFIQVQSLVDLAAKKRVISKNKAARLKSNLSKILPKSRKIKRRQVRRKTPMRGKSQSKKI